MSHTYVLSVQDVPYIRTISARCLIHTYYQRKMSHTYVLSAQDVPYIRTISTRCPIHTYYQRNMSHTYVLSAQHVPYIRTISARCPIHTYYQCKMSHTYVLSAQDVRTYTFTMYEMCSKEGNRPTVLSNVDVGLAKTIYIFMYGVYAVWLTGKSPKIRLYTWAITV